MTLPQAAADGLNFLAGLTGFRAAWIWRKSARIKYPQIIGKNVVSQPSPKHHRELSEGLDEGGKLSASAANWTAVAALLVALAAIASAF